MSQMLCLSQTALNRKQAYLYTIAVLFLVTKDPTGISGDPQSGFVLSKIKEIHHNTKKNTWKMLAMLE